MPLILGSLNGGLQPSTPTIGTATDGGTGTSASVAFTPSTYIGKGTITYTATSSPGGFTGTSATSPISVTGLTTGVAYTFTVTGTTNYGVTSIASGSSNSVTPANPDAGVMFPISSITLSSATSSVTFSSIPQTYTHLQIRAIAKNTGNNNETILFRFNGDTGSNYSFHRLFSDGSSASAYGEANTTYAGAGSSSNTQTAQNNMYAAFIYDVLDYSNTNKFKTARCLSGKDFNASGGNIFLFSGNWRNTNAITSITLSTIADSFAQYTQFALYGIKGA